MNYTIRHLIACLLVLRRIDGQQLTPVQEWRVMCRFRPKIIWENRDELEAEIRHLFRLRHA